MFACLYSLSAPRAALRNIAQDFTPRFEQRGSVVMLDIAGLTRLFGSAQEIGEHLRRAAGGCGGAPVRVAIASSQTAAALLALGRPGLIVVAPGDHAAALAPLPVGLLGELEKLRRPGDSAHEEHETRETKPQSGLRDPRDLRVNHTVSISSAAHSCCGGGWRHPRDSHTAQHLRRSRRGQGTRSPNDQASFEQVRRGLIDDAAKVAQAPESRALKAENDRIQDVLDTLRRWGIKTLGALAALPPGDVYERLGGRGVQWQRLARGEDESPLVPWVLEDPFEATLDLEWPIEGLEPLSFVLARLFEPLAERLERADRGAAILHTHLRLTTREVHARTLQLPAPMRDPKTLRTLVLLDLESNPPAAGVDRVRLLIEPTPARVLQWMLFERAQPSPEQVSTLLARLTALMGEGHVGSPQLMDSWKPGLFEMKPFVVPAAARPVPHVSEQTTMGTALRRFRLPVPARVQMREGRPIRVMTDRRGVAGGPVQQAAGPWRTSGEWWNDALGQVGQVGQVGNAPHQPYPPYQPYPPQCWDRDEWDVALADGTVYRLFVERDVGQWFIEGVVD